MDAKDIYNLSEAYLSVYGEVDELDEGNPIRRFLSNRKHRLRDTEKGHEDIMRRNREYQTKGKGPGGYRNKGVGRIEKVREEIDLYDIILSHLLDEGYAETPEAAEAIMVNMSEDWRDSIVDEMLDEAKVDTGLSDTEKRQSRSERGTVGYMHRFTRKAKKTRGEKTELLGSDKSGNPTGKYLRMKHEKKAAQRERDADEARRRDSGAQSRGTWDKD